MVTRADYIEPIVAQVVAAVRPVRVVLFGSHARGDARTDSDVDLLVVIPTELIVARRRARCTRFFARA